MTTRRRRSPGEGSVFEYKLTDEANQALDQAQVALYRRLLRGCLDVDAEPVILRFNPGLIATRRTRLVGSTSPSPNEARRCCVSPM